MKIIEHRRHAMRNIPDPHLNQEGVVLAREVGEKSGNFHKVITSTRPRAFETAIAMGYAVDRTLTALSYIEDEVEKEISWNAGFNAFSKAYSTDGAFSTWCNTLASIISKTIQLLPEDSNLLIISHGGIVEATAVAFFPDFDFSSWKQNISYCEGIKLYYENGKFTNIEFLTV